MNIGTTEPLKTDPTVTIRRSQRRSGGGGTGGRSGRNGGGGGPGPYPDHDGEPSSIASNDKAKIVTAFLLLAVLMTFGGLISAYVVIATNGVAEWKPFRLPFEVWISTALILLSSFAYHTAKNAVDHNDQDATRRWFIVTTVLGAAFISSQLLLWLELVRRGYYMGGNPYAGFFYILTAVHAAHVFGGIVALGCILLRTWNISHDDNEVVYWQRLARSIGWYWHFIGALWIVLLVLLGFWK